MADLQTIRAEQQAFDAMLPMLLPDHRGEFVVFKNGQPVEFFGRSEEAYSFGIEKFGVKGGFLMTRVEPKSARPVSYAWAAGVMFRGSK